jgi:predicted phage gp36 major capsid-like protein
MKDNYMTNIEKMRAALTKLEEAQDEVRELEQRFGLDRELANMSDDELRKIRDEQHEKYMSSSSAETMRLAMSVYSQMQGELLARGKSGERSRHKVGAGIAFSLGRMPIVKVVTQEGHERRVACNEGRSAASPSIDDDDEASL